MQIRFKEKITRAVRWLFHLFIEAFATANAVLKRLPSQIRERLFRLGAWGKKQLDKRINAFQRERLHTIVFKTETIEGRRFDRILTVIILFSIVVVMLETVSEFHRTYWWIFFVLEWLFTVLFTIEYILRLYCTKDWILPSMVSRNLENSCFSWSNLSMSPCNDECFRRR